VPCRAWMSWSGGKDAAWALHAARRSGEADVVGLLTTITQPYGRIALHGVREMLVQAQADALGLPLHRVPIPAACSNAQYDDLMRIALDSARAEGVTCMVIGDVFLEDVRAYRERRLAEVGMEARFPLWGRDTAELAHEMIAGGLRAYVTCLDPGVLPRALAGHAYDEAFLAALPDAVDPCGENGEFHTFAWEGPGFAAPIAVEVGETVERDGFVFTDVLPAEQAGGE
jgi:uncharacterized protein (TIGR00290 family)